MPVEQAGWEKVRTRYVEEWKEKGGKVLGYACLATPVEIIEAAGLLPYRIKALGNPNTELADSYLARFNCKFCRSCLQLGLDGTYDFLDGLVETNGCDQLRGMFENWKHVKDLEFFHYLKVPHYVREDVLDYFHSQVAQMKKAVSTHFSVDITDDSLAQAMERRKEVQAGLRSLYELREKEPPSITGSEVLSLIVTGSSMHSDDFGKVLSHTLESIEGGRISDGGTRLMLCGGLSDEVGLVGEIEAMGCIIVADNLCFGSRTFWDEPAAGGDPLRALSDAYLSNLLCPRMYLDYGRRRDHVLRTAERAGVDGAVIVYNKFCDLHGVEAVSLHRDLEEKGFPVLVLEKDYGAPADVGRIRTRVQAFLERIGG